MSAEYTILFEFEKIKQSIEFSDFVFANEHEAAAYGKKEGITDLTEVATKIASHKKLNNKPRVAIITQGANPVIVAVWNPELKDLKVNHYDVEKIDNDLIVDTCGAGDAFVGGFLS